MIQLDQRDELKSWLSKKGIGTSVHYPHILPDMKPFHSLGNYTNARKLSQRGLSLPLNPWLKEEEIDLVIAEILKFYKG